jgi:S1-C subfamily serine protease
MSHVFGFGAALAIGLAPFVPLAGCCADCADLSRIGAVSYAGPAVGSAPGSSASEQASGNYQLPQARKAASERPTKPLQPSELPAGTEAVASGFYVDNQGHLLTIWAEIRNCPKLAILDEYEFRPATLVNANPLSGLALLRVAAPKNVHPVFRGASIANGEPVSAFAYPIVDGLFMPIDVTESRVRSATSPDGRLGVFELGSTADVSTAGGPIVDQRGDVVGITVRRLNAAWPDDRTYGITNAPVLQFLSTAGVKVSTREIAAVGGISADQSTMRHAGDYTAPVLCSR